MTWVARLRRMITGGQDPIVSERVEHLARVQMGAALDDVMLPEGVTLDEIAEPQTWFEYCHAHNRRMKEMG